MAFELDKNNYEIGQASYPSDLMSAKNLYGGNYVVFNIYVHQDSALIKDGRNPAAVPGNVPMGGEVRSIPLSDETATNITRGAVTLGTAAAVAKITSGITSLGPLTRIALTAATAAGVGFGADRYIKEVLGGVKKEYVKLDRSIALHAPNDLSIKYGTTWTEFGMAETSAALQLIENGTDDLKKAGGITLSYLAGAALRTANQTGVGEAFGKIAGIAGNPKKEQLFQNVNFRTFSFSYQFFPRDQGEAQQVLDIIKTFKLHMHPEFLKDGYNFIYIYPSEFEIKYYINGAENKAIHKHTSCVLENLSVSYAPQSQFTTFKDGTPTQINITLDFKELALLTKENIDDGY